jgi:hypothetical protein
MSSIKTAYDTLVTMTVTNLHSLANSATAGWQSAVVDNSSGLWLDALVQVTLDFANTAPGSSLCAYVLAYGGIESGVYSNPASGSEGTITLTNVTTTGQNMRLLGTIPYTTQNEVAESSPFSVATAFGGVLPKYWGVVIINFSGAALAASGNTVKYLPVYSTVA